MPTSNKSGPEAIFWIVLAPTFASLLTMSYLIWTHSAHEPGSTEDSAFWALIQNLITSLLSAIAIAIETYRDTKIPPATRLAVPVGLGVSILANLGSVIAYPLVRTEISTLLQLIASALQSLVFVSIVTWKKEKIE